MSLPVFAGLEHNTNCSCRGVFRGQAPISQHGSGLYTYNWTKDPENGSRLISGDVRAELNEHPPKPALRNPSQQASKLVIANKKTGWSDVPQEIRDKIWGYAAADERIIELKRGYNHCMDVRVCRLSRKVPVVLQVCRESRKEAIRLGYKYSHFEYSATDPDPTKPGIWFHKKHDTILFGESSCITTVMLTMNHFKDEIENVALHMSNEMTICNGEDCQWSNHVSLLEALHGFDNDFDGSEGCKGLKSVKFVIKTNLWRLSGARVPQNAIVRSAVTQGITRGMRSLYTNLSADITKLKDGNALNAFVGENRWSEDSLPDFTFVHLTNPAAYDEIQPVYDCVTTNDEGWWKLFNAQKRMLVGRIAERTGANIYLSDNEFPGQEPREIGVVGTAHAVRQAKQELGAFFVSPIYYILIDMPTNFYYRAVAHKLEMFGLD